MKALPLEKMFLGCNGVTLPDEVNASSLVCPTVVNSRINNQSVLFLIDKVNGENSAFNTSLLKELPYAIVASKSRKVTTSSVPIIRADDPREALSFSLSNAYDIDYEKIKIIGVTGTNGKTTTATLIYEILKMAGYRVGFIGTGKIISNGLKLTDNVYSMTTPDPTVLYPALAKMTEDGCQYVVMEVSSHSLALGKVAPIKFEYAIFTNFDTDHLDFHKTKDEYFKAKMKLFSLAKRCLFNIDEVILRQSMDLLNGEVNTFGIVYQGDAYATEIDTTPSESRFFYRDDKIIFKVKANLGGAFNVYNIIAALKCTIDLGIKPCIAKEALAKIKKVEGRMELIDGKIKVIIDYAHTPSAFYNCLKTIKDSIISRQRLILVFGCGGDRDKTKRPIFGKYAEKFADSIIITEDNSRSESFDSIANDIALGIKNSEYRIIPDRESAIRYAIKTATDDDIVVLIGKGHEKYKIVKGNYIPFDERIILEKAIKEINKDNAYYP